jgi:4-amino-4-deoxy-L-arabinose transferase-like glycosyltransferase
VLLWTGPVLGARGGRETAARPEPGYLTWRRALAAGLVLGAAVPVRQVGEILILPAICYVLVTVPGWRTKLARGAVLCAAFAVPFLAYCTTSYAVKGSFALSHTGVTTTYGRMAYAADCSTLSLTPAQRPLCPDAKQHTLGPDGLLHNPSSPLKPVYRRLPHAQASQLVESFNSRVIRQQPGRVLAAVGRDFGKLFAVSRVTAPGDDPISRWQFQLSYPYMYPHASPKVLKVATSEFGGGMPKIWLPAAKFLRAYQLDGGYTPGPLLLICLLAGLAGAITSLVSRTLDAGRRELARASLAFVLTAAPLLLISDLFVYSWRYQQPALVTLPAAAALAAACLPWRALRADPAARSQDPAVLAAGPEPAAPPE